MTFNMNELSLANVEMKNVQRKLKAGQYVCKVTDAKLQATKAKNGSMIILVSFEDLKSGDTIDTSLNVHNVTSKQATQIGREQLKKLCVYGGHPTPDSPGDTANLVGLIVGVGVKSTTYHDQKTGEEKQGSDFSYFCDPYEVDSVAYPEPRPLPKAPSNDMPNDDIPF